MNLSLRRHFAAAAISVAILLSGGACTADHPTGGPSATASASASTTVVSAVDREICATVMKASRDLVKFLLANPIQDGEAASVDALMEFATLVQEKKADAIAPRLRDALQGLAATAEMKAIRRDDDAVTVVGYASERLNRPCGEPPKDQFAAGDRIGCSKSPCELPVSFQIGEGWRALAVGDAGGEQDRKGSLRMVGEIAPGSAGYIAFIRVWTDPGASGGPRPALDAFLRGVDVRKPVWSDLILDGAPGTEVVYETYSESLRETRTERAFAVQTPQGVVVIMAGGMDANEQVVVAAYEHAKKTLTINS